MQIPRLGAGVGLFGAAALGYLDQVVVLTMTNGAGVAMLNPSCKARSSRLRGCVDRCKVPRVYGNLTVNARDTRPNQTRPTSRAAGSICADRNKDLNVPPSLRP